MLADAASRCNDASHHTVTDVSHNGTSFSHHMISALWNRPTYLYCPVHNFTPVARIGDIGAKALHVYYYHISDRPIPVSQIRCSFLVDIKPMHIDICDQVRRCLMPPRTGCSSATVRCIHVDTANENGTGTLDFYLAIRLVATLPKLRALTTKSTQHGVTLFIRLKTLYQIVKTGKIFFFYGRYCTIKLSIQMFGTSELQKTTRIPFDYFHKPF